MKVSDLIIELEKMPQDKEVKTEGCDCSGDVAGVILSEDYGVYIYRSDGDQARGWND